MGKVVVKIKLTNNFELDFVVDPRGQKLIPNPAHGDKQMSEEYRLR